MYQPKRPPADEAGFRLWTQEEHAAIAAQFVGEFDGLRFRVLHAEPTRKYEGLAVYADGTDWNPGGGKGWFGWNGASWVRLG